MSDEKQISAEQQRTEYALLEQHDPSEPADFQPEYAYQHDVPCVHSQTTQSAIDSKSSTGDIYDSQANAPYQVQPESIAHRYSCQMQTPQTSASAWPSRPLVYRSSQKQQQTLSPDHKYSTHYGAEQGGSTPGYPQHTTHSARRAEVAKAFYKRNKGAFDLAFQPYGSAPYVVGDSHQIEFENGEEKVPNSPATESSHRYWTSCTAAETKGCPAAITPVEGSTTAERYQDTSSTIEVNKHLDQTLAASTEHAPLQARFEPQSSTTKSKRSSRKRLRSASPLARYAARFAEYEKEYPKPELKPPYSDPFALPIRTKLVVGRRVLGVSRDKWKSFKPKHRRFGDDDDTDKHKVGESLAEISENRRQASVGSSQARERQYEGDIRSGDPAPDVESKYLDQDGDERAG